MDVTTRDSGTPKSRMNFSPLHQMRYKDSLHLVDNQFFHSQVPISYSELGPEKFTLSERPSGSEDYHQEDLDIPISMSMAIKRPVILQTPSSSFQDPDGYRPSQTSHSSEYVFYPSAALERYRSFAGSPPTHLGYNHMHHSSFGDSVPVTEEGVVDATNFSLPPSQDKPNLKRYPYDRPQYQKPGSLNDSMENYKDIFAAQANVQAIMEKRRRRRESHNAVERRRRDNINDRIQELGKLLPHLEEEGVNRLNKGTILRKSVDQIKQLQRDVGQCQQRVHELETLLKQLARQRTSSAQMQQ
ncbi:helix-loop-helix DNA-binding domain-containing protein [Spinellus fusiger]|nr:helix-loop-helix DNA-binding domain-containing protein [Spinellus fusiger]